MNPRSHEPAIGIVGVGSLGYHHARILSTLGSAKMVGLFDVNAERAEHVGQDLGVTVHPSLESLLDRADAVVVAVPTLDHESVSIAALERGIDVLIEKPMAASLEEADRILAVALAKGALVQVGHIERFNSAIVAARPFLEEPLFVESHRLASFVPRSTDIAVVLDLMIHDVDLVQSLVGRPITDVAATGVPVLTSTVDIANARLVFEGGAVANLTASRVSMERMRKIRIFQASGYLSLDLANGTGEFLRLKRGLPLFADGQAWDAQSDADLSQIVDRIAIQGRGEEPLAMELENFRDAVAGQGVAAVSGEEGRSALEISLLIEERIEAHVVDTHTA